MSDRVNPFQGLLWVEAQPLIRRQPDGLQLPELLQLVDGATADGVVTPEEDLLLRTVADPRNVRQLATALDAGVIFPSADTAFTDLVSVMAGVRTTFDPSSLHFDSPDARAIQVNTRLGLAGQIIGRSYRPDAQIDRAAIQTAAATTRLGPDQALTLTTAEGRAAIMDRYGQMAGSDIYGWQACSGASLLMVGINAGPAGLLTLARMVSADQPTDRELVRIVAALRQPDPQLSLADLAFIQDGLMNMMQNFQINADVLAGHVISDEVGGLRPETITRFIDAHRTDLAPLFANGSSIRAIDNSGDGNLDHFVAVVVDPAGRASVAEPWERMDGHHLLSSPAVVRVYQDATVSTHPTR